MDSPFFPFLNIRVTLEFLQSSTQHQRSVIGCRLLLKLETLLHFVQEAAASQTVQSWRRICLQLLYLFSRQPLSDCHSLQRLRPQIFFSWLLGVTKRCRLSLLTNSAPRNTSPNAGRGWGCGVSANEYSSVHHVTWSPNKLWRSTSIFNLWLAVGPVYPLWWRRQSWRNRSIAPPSLCRHRSILFYSILLGGWGRGRGKRSSRGVLDAVHMLVGWQKPGPPGVPKLMRVAVVVIHAPLVCSQGSGHIGQGWIVHGTHRAKEA